LKGNECIYLNNFVFSRQFFRIRNDQQQNISNNLTMAKNNQVILEPVKYLKASQKTLGIRCRKTLFLLFTETLYIR